jgi:hypothetical protein
VSRQEERRVQRQREGVQRRRKRIRPLSAPSARRQALAYVPVRLNA